MESAHATREDWRAFRNLTGATILIHRSAVGRPQLRYVAYWLGHLPRGAGVTEGFHGNWWQYIVNYNRALAQLPVEGGFLLRAGERSRWRRYIRTALGEAHRRT